MRALVLGLAFAVHVFAQAPDGAVGRRIFESQCALCHGQTGGGGRGPALNRPKLDRAPDDAALRSFISEGGGDMPGAWQLHEDELAGVAAYVRTLGAMPPEAVPGDPASGARVYAASGCPGCHMIRGEGAGFGPELTAIGSRRSAAFLRQTILKPAATLPEGFLYVAAVPSSGAAVRGIRVNEDSFTIQLRDAGGRYYSFRKSELTELRRLEGATPMPPYEGKIPGNALDDLVAYLAGLKGKL
uniref:Putative heme-binding protein n=1 Tax=Solibacter usitatus (strain Ellin6076) TaxID=234267 RepID=Q01XT0_SOLUE